MLPEHLEGTTKSNKTHLFDISDTRNKLVESFYLYSLCNRGFKQREITLSPAAPDYCKLCLHIEGLKIRRMESNAQAS